MTNTTEIKMRAGIEPYRRRLQMKKNRNEYRATCCWHKPDRHPSLTVFEKDGTWLFKCWGCGASGDVISFVQKCDNVSFTVAVQTIAQECGVDSRSMSR